MFGVECKIFSASLLLASVGHESEVVRYMTRLAGASLVATGCEVTHYASRGEAGRVRDLLQRGVDPNGIEPEKFESNLVPLIAAARIGDLEMVRLFVECGATVNRVETGTKSNLLHVSIQHGHSKLVRYLIGALTQAQIEQLATQTDSEGRTPLRIAAWEGLLDIVRAIKPFSDLNQVKTLSGFDFNSNGVSTASEAVKAKNC